LLNALANPVVHVSQRVGDGARTKLVNNLLAAINLVGASEVMNLAIQMGLAPHTTLQVMQSSSGQSWIATDRLRRVFAQDTTVGSHMRLLAKDTRLAMQAAAQVGYGGWLGGQAAKAFAMACEQGMTDRDDSAMLEFIRMADKT